jgi:tRNA threonylcarbamoyladenosine biosynthesis protein TsaE
MKIQVTIPAPEEAGASARELLKAIGGHRKITFQGEMGAGKTTLIQALCEALGVDQVVTSPTFALINEYFTPEGDSVYHFDLYRIDDITELYDIGYEDYFFSDGWCFVEWPEKAEELIPDHFLRLYIEVNEDGSRIVHN